MGGLFSDFKTGIILDSQVGSGVGSGEKILNLSAPRCCED
jgi:hypothetical protein